MASCSREQPLLNDKDTLLVGRFVYDVMVYTLPICGYPEPMLPTTDCDEIVYNRANLVKIAGTLTLRAALIMRDKWKQMFQSRLRSSGFKGQEVATLLAQIHVCCPLNRVSAVHSAVDEFLAMCNEMILFCLHESIDIDPILLIKSTASYIIFRMGANQNISRAVEELIYANHDVLKYTRWLIDFISKFAIPYGSRDDISDIFIEHSEERDKAVVQGPYPVDRSVLNLQNQLGFLPHEAFSAIAVEGSRNLPENLELASGSTLPGDRESPEPPKLPDSSKSGNVARRK